MGPSGCKVVQAAGVSPPINANLTSGTPPPCVPNALYTCFCVQNASHSYLTLWFQVSRQSHPQTPPHVTPTPLTQRRQHQTFRPQFPRRAGAMPVCPPSNPLLLAEVTFNNDLVSLPGMLFYRWAYGLLPNSFYLFVQMSLDLILQLVCAGHPNPAHPALLLMFFCSTSHLLPYSRIYLSICLLFAVGVAY